MRHGIAQTSNRHDATPRSNGGNVSEAREEHEELVNGSGS